MKAFQVSHRALCVALAMGASVPAMAAQEAAEPPANTYVGGTMDADIIVTARKRDETLMSVPVVISAVSAETLSNRGIINLDGLARAVPQLLIGPQGGAIQGGNMSIRGISGPDQNPFGDQAVSFNIDGVQIAKATVRRMSDFDQAQIEVLKGPQALFFGKNSPAGIVSIRTADPTDSLSAGIKAGYEFYADEIRTEAFVAGPITDTLGFRIAGMFDDMKGYLDDMTPENSPYRPKHGRNPNSQEWAVRGTLKWEAADNFDARLKVNYSKLKQNGPASMTAFISCPDGVRQTGSGIDQCSASQGANVNAGYGTVIAGIPATLNKFRSDGENFLDQKQLLTGLEMNWRPSDSVTLTSVTGYFDLKLDQCQNYENDTSFMLPSCNVYNNQEFSQEFRFTTDFDSPVNVTGGVYYSGTDAATGSMTYLFGGAFDMFPEGALGPGSPAMGGPATPVLLNNYYFEQRGKTYSAYLQLSYKPIEEIEINAGGRYTKEKKRLPIVRNGGGLQDGILPGIFILDPSTEVPNVVRKGSWNDFSPEVTLSYRPNQNLTMFTSYKHGFLSGGFNSGSVTFNLPNLDLSYDPQTIKGFEAGVKAQLFDNSLRANAAVYSYKVKDQQVSNVFNSTNTISNAGAVKIEGVEVDFQYRTPLQGLELRGAAAYNKAKYTEYPNAPCYGGQTFAMGCVNGQQDLGGTELIRAPKWHLTGGFDYSTQFSEALGFGLSGGVTYSDSYLTDASSAPNGRQPSYTLFDATARVFGPDNVWELAVIGRNLTDKYYFVASSLVPFAESPNGNLSDRFASLSRGREIMLRVSYRFGN